MSWQGSLRRAGFNPEKVQDAKKGLTLGQIEKGDLKGAVLGSPTMCCGAKGIIRNSSAQFAWVGAKIAVIVHSKNKITRYEHNGSIPSTQDQGFYPIGYPIRLKRPAPSHRLEEKRRASRGPKGPKLTKRVNDMRLVGEFRRRGD